MRRLVRPPLPGSNEVVHAGRMDHRPRRGEMSSLLDGARTPRGEVAEGLNAAVSKTLVPRKWYRGFESPLRFRKPRIVCRDPARVAGFSRLRASSGASRGQTRGHSTAGAGPRRTHGHWTATALRKAVLRSVSSPVGGGEQRQGHSPTPIAHCSELPAFTWVRKAPRRHLVAAVFAAHCPAGVLARNMVLVAAPRAPTY